MIDHEQEVFKKLSTEIRKYYTDCFITGSISSATPSKFPTISIIKTDDPIVQQYCTFDENENVTNETYEITVVSNLLTGKELQTKEIMKVINNVLMKNGFIRLFNQPVSTTDSTLAKRVARYGKKNTI